MSNMVMVAYDDAPGELSVMVQQRSSCVVLGRERSCARWSSSAGSGASRGSNCPAETAWSASWSTTAPMWPWLSSSELIRWVRLAMCCKGAVAPECAAASSSRDRVIRELDPSPPPAAFGVGLSVDSFLSRSISARLAASSASILACLAAMASIMAIMAATSVGAAAGTGAGTGGGEAGGGGGAGAGAGGCDGLGSAANSVRK